MGIHGFLPALLSGVLTLAAAMPALAETRLYQWTDAQGRVQYSDQAPENNPAANARSISTRPQLPPVRTFKPVPLPAGKLLPVAVALPEYSALQSAGTLGRLYIAADCINPSEIGWADLQGGGSIFLEGNRRHLAESAAKVLRDLGYDAQGVVVDSDWNNIAAAGGLRLVPVIRAVDARVCTSKFTSTQVRRDDIPRLIQVSGDRAGIWIQVRWELWRKGGRYPVKIFDTEGANMQWRDNGSLWLVTHEALREATRNLAGYPGLGATLKSTSAMGSLPAAESSASSSLDSAKESVSGFIDNMTARFTIRAKVAQALGLVSPLKPAIVNFYQENGRWPTDITALLPPGAKLAQEGLIDDVTLTPEGALRIAFAKEVSPQGWLRLTPQDNNNMRIDWACSSNLPPAALDFGGNVKCQSRPDQRY